MTKPSEEGKPVQKPAAADPSTPFVKQSTPSSDKETSSKPSASQEKSQEKAMPKSSAVPAAFNTLKQASKARPVDRLHSGYSIIPRETISGSALILVVAIMSFLASMTFGVVSMINNSADSWQSDISNEVTIQIDPVDAVEMEKLIQKAIKIALVFEGVDKVTALSDVETARLLEPWLGSGLNLEELPVPRLLLVTLDEDVRPDMQALREALVAEVPSSSLDDHQVWVERLSSMAFSLVSIGVVIFLLVLAATAITVIFATRAAMAGNKSVVEVLHFVGADSSFISKLFQKHFLTIGFKGACAGVLGAIILFFILGVWSSGQVATPEGDQMTALFGSFSLSWLGLFGMLIVLVIVAVLTAITSSLTVRRQVNILQNYKK